MILFAALMSSVVGAAPVITVPTDKFVPACRGLQMKARRTSLTVVCRDVPGGVELEIDDGDINGLALEATKWPKTVRFVMIAWTFEGLNALVVTRDGKSHQVTVVSGTCKPSEVRCLGREAKKTAENGRSEVTVRFEVDGAKLAPGASINVGWIDAYRR